jgi:hypothetical protein
MQISWPVVAGESRAGAAVASIASPFSGHAVAQVGQADWPTVESAWAHATAGWAGREKIPGQDTALATAGMHFEMRSAAKLVNRERRATRRLQGQTLLGAAVVSALPTGSNHLA